MSTVEEASLLDEKRGSQVVRDARPPVEDVSGTVPGPLVERIVTQLEGGDGDASIALLIEVADALQIPYTLDENELD